MTFDELYKAILKLLPAAQIGEDMEGQIVVYTDMMIDPDSPSGQVVAYLDPDEVAFLDSTEDE